MAKPAEEQKGAVLLILDLLLDENVLSTHGIVVTKHVMKHMQFQWCIYGTAARCVIVSSSWTVAPVWATRTTQRRCLCIAQAA